MRACSKGFNYIISKQLIEKMTSAKWDLDFIRYSHLYTIGFVIQNNGLASPASNNYRNRTLIEERDIEHVLQLIGLATLFNLLFISKSLSLLVAKNLYIWIL